MTTINIRKWLVTTCRQKKAEGTKIDEVSLCQSMCHSFRAAENFYLRDLTRTAAIAADIIDLCTSNKTTTIEKQRTTEDERSRENQVAVDNVPADVTESQVGADLTTTTDRDAQDQRSTTASS